MPTGRSPGLLGWCAVASFLLALRLGVPPRPAVTHDAFQYLSAASQARSGAVGQTAIVHFDAEHSFGVVPAPLVTFPMGFPLAVAAVSATGVPPELAGAVVSAAAFLATLVLLWWLAAHAGMTGTERDIAMLLTVTSGALLQFAGTVSTEMLFTAVITGAFVLLQSADAGTGRRGMWALAGLMLGLAYHVRYAGLFLVAGLGPVTAWHLLVFRDRTRASGAFIAGCSATVVVALGFARNILLVGNWRGGNEKVVSHPLSDVAIESVRAAHGLVLGPGWGVIGQSLAIRAAFFGALAIGVVWLLARRRAPDPTTARPDWSRLAPLAIMVAVYTAGMVYAALTSVISYGTRMFVPLVPVLSLLTVGSVRCLAWGRTKRTSRSRFAVAALLIAYVGLNATALGRPPVDRVSMVRAQLDAVDDAGRSVREVLTDLLGSTGVLLANNGQAVGYVLDRRTVSLVGPRYSVQEWDENGVRELVRRFGVKAVLITSPNVAQPDEPDLIPSPFVRALANGHAPTWLRPLGRVGALTIYAPIINRSDP